jgi:hypothetical protein
MRLMPMGRIAAAILAATGAMAGPAAAAPKNGRIALPVIVDPATPDSGEPVEVAAQQLFGKQTAHVASLARLTAPVQLMIKKTPVTLAPADGLAEYRGYLGKETFALFCTARAAKPVAALLCLADRDGDGRFDQFWTGTAANPALAVPFPNIRFQSDIEPAAYQPMQPSEADAMAIGFVGSGGNVWTGKREFFVRVERPGASVLLFESRATGTAKNGPVDIALYDAIIHLVGDSRDAFRLKVAKPLGGGTYQLSVGYPTQTIWIAVPGG